MGCTSLVLCNLVEIVVGGCVGCVNVLQVSKYGFCCWALALGYKLTRRDCTCQLEVSILCSLSSFSDHVKVVNLCFRKFMRMFNTPSEKTIHFSPLLQSETTDIEFLSPDHDDKNHPRKQRISAFKLLTLSLLTIVIFSLGFLFGRLSNLNTSSWVSKITRYCLSRPIPT